MAYEIKSESYGRRLPKITATADSTDDLATLGIDWAEGSSCVIGDKTYTLDKVQGWIEAGSGGGGASILTVTISADDDLYTLDKTWAEIYDAMPMVVCKWESDASPVLNMYEDGNGFHAAIYGGGNQLNDFVASSENDYPTYDNG